MNYESNDERYFYKNGANNISLTIEQQLEDYTKYRNSTDRHDTLWHGWKHNKRWLGQMLEWVLMSFPNYSRHDETHAQAVIHNIEMLLGEEAIRNLSASDCFMILHVAYIHDIGMCITDAYRKKLISSPEFKKYLQNKVHDDHLKEYADLLLARCDELQERCDENYEKRMSIYLDIYYAVLYLIAEYRRGEHGQESKRMLREWMDPESKMGSGFATSGIPSRFFYTIAECASVHTSFQFRDVLALPKIDGGYAHDHIHPRFIAVLLQLGDALDMDNDRFLPLGQEILGHVPYNSRIHFGKHKAIRRLYISSSKIIIDADCESAEELRLVRWELEGLEDILKNASLHWSEICPDEVNARLPVLEIRNMLLRGCKISQNLVNAKFEIKQEKAFHILQGSNIYKNDKLVFLREILQNAVDASKRQYWYDWKGSKYGEKEKKEAWKYLSLYSYPIEVEIHLAVREKNSRHITIMDCENVYRGFFREEKAEKNEDDLCLPEMKIPDRDKRIYGVIVRISDCGTGITEKDIKTITDVGTTQKDFEAREDGNDEIPHWLCATAEFGIGLQSIFLVSDFFTAYTHARNGEAYEIQFNGGRNEGDNFINVIPKCENERKEYGTTFEVFVPAMLLKTMRIPVDQHSIVLADPFSLADRRKYQDLFDMMELGNLIYEYLDGIVGEKLFPLKAKLYGFRDSLKYVGYHFPKNGRKIRREIYIEGNFRSEKEPVSLFQSGEEDLGWLYRMDPKKYFPDYLPEDAGRLYEIREVKLDEERFQYRLNVAEGRLYLYSESEKYSVLVAFGPSRLLEWKKRLNTTDGLPEKPETKIYYKGIFVCDMALENDFDMLEYIDIKAVLNRKYLAINRSEFTDEGKRYIKEELCPQILKMIGRAVEDFSVFAGSSSICEIFDRVLDFIETEARTEKEEAKERMHGCILGLTGLAAFARLQNSRTYLYPHYVSGNEESEKIWKDILEHISKQIEVSKSQHTSDHTHWSRSGFYSIRVFDPLSGSTNSSSDGGNRRSGKDDEGGNPPDQTDRKDQNSNELNIVKLINEIDQYVIVASRYTDRGSWQEHLIHALGMENILKQYETTQQPEDRPCMSLRKLSTLKDVIMELKTEADKKEKEALTDLIDIWISEMDKSARNRNDIRNWVSRSPSEAESLHLILRWLLDNMPSLALFMRNARIKTAPTMQNPEYRFNVMDTQFTDSIYLDRNTKFAVYERMSGQWKIQPKKQRFSMPATTSFCQLAVHPMPRGVYFVNRGKISQEMRKNIILPLTGSSLTALMKKINEGELQNLVSVFEQIADFITTKFKDENKDSGKYGRGVGKKLAFTLSNFKEQMNRLSEEEKQKKAVRDGEISAKIWEKIAEDDLKKHCKYIEEMVRDPSDQKNTTSIGGCCTSQKKASVTAADKRKKEESEEWIRSELLPRWDAINKNTTDLIRQFFERYDEVRQGSIQDLVWRDFAYDEVSKSAEEYEATKTGLIRWVWRHRWIPDLDSLEIEKMYKEYISDMLFCMAVPIEERINAVKRKFSLPVL